VRSKLNKFLRYLQIEKGFSQGTIEAYQLDIEKGQTPGGENLYAYYSYR